MITTAGYQKSYSMWQRRLKNHVLCLSDHVFTLLVHPSVSSPSEDSPAFYFYWKRFRHFLADATATTLGLLHTLNILSELRLGGVRRENRVFFPLVDFSFRRLFFCDYTLFSNRRGRFRDTLSHRRVVFDRICIIALRLERDRSLRGRNSNFQPIKIKNKQHFEPLRRNRRFPLAETNVATFNYHLAVKANNNVTRMTRLMTLYL